MPVSQKYLDYILDQLEPFGPASAKRMFGGAGLYFQGMFFGIVVDDALYFKVDETNKPDYLAAGSGPFTPRAGYAMSFWEVPVDVLEDEDDLKEWAEKSVEAARRNAEKKTWTAKQRSAKRPR